jgi:hypothetical protein
LKKAISFLGTANYAMTSYALNDRSFKTNLFPEALNNFFNPDELLVCLAKREQKMLS